MHSYFGAYYHEKNKKEEIENEYRRLVELYTQQQNIIIDQSVLIKELRAGVCRDHTSVTYTLKPIELI